MYPKGSLATHLSGGSYRNQMVEVPGASRSESKPDLKLALARPAPASSASSRASKAKSQKLKKCKALLSSPTKAISAAKPPVVCVAPKRQSGKRAPGKKGKSGVNGHDYRESIHCHFGDENYDRLKFGNNPQAVKKKAQQTYRAKIRLLATTDGPSSLRLPRSGRARPEGNRQQMRLRGLRGAPPLKLKRKRQM